MTFNTLNAIYALRFLLTLTPLKFCNDIVYAKRQLVATIQKVYLIHLCSLYHL